MSRAEWGVRRARRLEVLRQMAAMSHCPDCTLCDQARLVTVAAAGGPYRAALSLVRGALASALDFHVHIPWRHLLHRFGIHYRPYGDSECWICEASAMDPGLTPADLADGEPCEAWRKEEEL